MGDKTHTPASTFHFDNQTHTDWGSFIASRPKAELVERMKEIHKILEADTETPPHIMALATQVLTNLEAYAATEGKQQ